MDKALHFIIGLTIAASIRNFGGNRWLAFGLVVVVGTAKEVRDNQGYGTPEVADAVWTAAGGLVGALAADPNRDQVYRDTHGARAWAPNAFVLAQVDSVARCLHVPVIPLEFNLAGPKAEKREGVTLGRRIYITDTTDVPLVRHEITHGITGVRHGDRRESVVFTARCGNWPLK